MKTKDSGLEETDVNAGDASKQKRPLRAFVTPDSALDLGRLMHSLPRDVIKKVSCHDLKRICQNYNTIPCPNCYGGHQRPCQWCGDSGSVVFIPNEDLPLPSVEALNVSWADQVQEQRCPHCGSAEIRSGLSADQPETENTWYCEHCSKEWTSSPPDTVLPEKEEGFDVEISTEPDLSSGNLRPVIRPLGLREASSESVETSRQKELLPWTADEDGTLRWNTGEQYQVFYLGKTVLNINIAKVIADAHNATLSAPSDNVSAVKTDLGLPGGERAVEHVLQNALKALLARWMQRSAGYVLIRCFSVSDAINECMENLEEILSEHGDSSTASGVSASPDSSSPATTVPASPATPIDERRVLGWIRLQADQWSITGDNRSLREAMALFVRTIDALGEWGKANEPWPHAAEQAPAAPTDEAPNTIYLQYHGDGEPDDESPVRDADVTWCRDKIFEHDLEYIRMSPPSNNSGNESPVASKAGDAPRQK